MWHIRQLKYKPNNHQQFYRHEYDMIHFVLHNVHNEYFIKKRKRNFPAWAIIHYVYLKNVLPYIPCQPFRSKKKNIKQFHNECSINV